MRIFHVLNLGPKPGSHSRIDWLMASAFNIFRLAGDFIHVVSIFLLYFKMKNTRSCAGIWDILCNNGWYCLTRHLLGLSLKSQLLYMVVYVTRYMDIFYISRFDILHIYNFIMKCLFLGSQAAVLFYSWFRFRATYSAKLDTFRIEALILPAIVGAFFFEDSGPRASTLLYIREVKCSSGFISLLFSSCGHFPSCLNP